MNIKNILIRETTHSDFNSIMQIEKQAFNSNNEAELVAQLFGDKSAEPIISLLAFNENEAVGHIYLPK